MRAFLVGLSVGLMGCASTRSFPPVREYDYCQATSVNSVTDSNGAGSWTADCINQWELRQAVIFDKPVHSGDHIYYVPYKENDGGDLHGYAKVINGQRND